MLRIATAMGRSARLVSLAALLAAPLTLGCTEHRSIFDVDGGTDAGTDGGPSDGGPSDGGPAGIISIQILSIAPLQIGATAAVHVEGTHQDGSTEDVTSQSTLTSSNPGVASLSGSTLTGVARGTTVIQAQLPVGGQPLEAAASVTVQGVNQGMTVSVQVAPATLTLAPGLGAQLSANATQGDGSQLSVTNQAHWTSSDATLCTVDDNGDKGFVTAVAVGNCTVTAAYNGKSGTSAVSIQALSVTALAITPDAATVGAGATVVLTATATLSDGSAADATRSATWASSDTTKATVQTGTVTGVAVGSATITATLSSISATAAITISAATLKSISVAPPQTVIAAGLTQQYAATAVYSDGTTSDITAQATWTSDTPAVAAIDASVIGLVDALTPGRANISAAFSGVTGVGTLQVTAATPTSMTLRPSPITLPAGVSQQVLAVATFTDNSVRDVSSNVAWSVGNPTFATVSSSGLLAGIAAGSTALTATLGAVTATDNVTVTAAALAQILILPQSSSVSVGGTQQLTASGIYGDNSIHDVTALATWTSTAPAIATVSNSTGTRGLATGAGAGTTTIAANLSGITSSPASITVSAAALVSIALTPRQILTAVYITVPTQVTARYADGSQINVTSQAVFSSASTAIASVVAAGADAGEVTGVGQGQTMITATFGGQSASAQATVVAAMLNSIQIAQPRGTIEVGQSAQLTATAQFQGAPIGIDVTTLVTWTSSDSGVGRFVAAPNGLFTAQGAGTVTVAAELDGVSGTKSITVSPTTPISIAISTTAFTLPIGVTRALVATGTYADGSTQDLTYGATWTSDANNVAVVGDTGVLKGFVTGVSAGTAHITATLDGISGSATATIDNANATSISVTPLDPTVALGNGGGGMGGGGMGGMGGGTAKEFYATAQFDDNTMQDVTESAVWTSSNPTVATISDQAGTKGVAEVIAAGASTITANFRGITAVSQLTAR